MANTSLLQLIQNSEDISLSPEDESDFQRQYLIRSIRLRLNPNPDSPLGFYNNRKAYLELKKQGLNFMDQDHLGSIGLKRPGHPTQFGYDTKDGNTLINRITGMPATEQDIFLANKVRQAYKLEPLDWSKEAIRQRELEQEEMEQRIRQNGKRQ